MQAEKRGVMLVVGVLLISAALGGIYGPSVKATAAGANDLQDAVRSFTRVLDLVQRNYAVPVDTDRAIYSGAIPGMLRVLDPHSNFYDSRQFNLLREDQRGKYYGVGMTVAPRDGRTVVLAPFVGSPAYKAGIRPGDVILKVDEKPAEGLSTAEVADLLKGAKGTIVRITVIREGYDEPLLFTITRDEIPRHAVDMVFLLKPGIGYVRLSGFNETTDRDLTDALKSLSVSKLDGLVLDLRANPGGLLNEGVAVADMFLDRGQLIVTHKGRSSPPRSYSAIRGNQGVEVPLVVLINGNSASAAEIVAGAIQDHDRGLLVGENSFGKGLVQTVSQLGENTGLALTTAKYYTPSGRLIQRDYKAVSLYEYHYNRKNNNQPTEIKLTDSGRQVYGGGGIAPDVTVPLQRLNEFQTRLLTRDVFFLYEQGVGGFTRWFMGRKPEISRDFRVTDEVLSQFRKYLDRQGIRYTEPEIAENQAWIQRKIRKEVFTSEFGVTDGFRVELEEDPQVQKAIEVLPQARALYQNAKKVIAQRTGGQAKQARQ